MKLLDRNPKVRMGIVTLFLSVLCGCTTTSEYVGDPNRYESSVSARKAIENGLQSAVISIEEDDFEIRDIEVTSAEVSWTEVQPTGLIGYMTKNPLFTKVERVSFQYNDLDLNKIRVREGRSESELVLPVTHYIRQGRKVRKPIKFKFEEREEASRVADALIALCKAGKL